MKQSPNVPTTPLFSALAPNSGCGSGGGGGDLAGEVSGVLARDASDVTDTLLLLSSR